MSSLLVLDLESVLDTSLPAPPEQSEEEKLLKKKPPFPPPPLHQIVCAGWALLDANYIIQDWGVLDEAEPIILQKLLQFLEALDPVVVTMNGRQFDMPVVAARCYVHGLSFPWYYRARFGARYRYSREDTYDVMDHLCDHGAAPRANLNVWARAAGWPGKIGGSGAGVQEMWDALVCSACKSDNLTVHGGASKGPNCECMACGVWMVPTNRFPEICVYCLGDIVQQCAVLLRAELLRGVLDLSEYRLAAEALLEKAESDPRTAPLAFSVDRARFLCNPNLNSREDADEFRM